MKKNLLLLASVCFILAACHKDQTITVKLDGEMIAKTILTVTCELPKDASDPGYSWFISSSPDGEWEKLPGIWSNQIVLLTAWEGKYVKCEINGKIGKEDGQYTASVISTSAVVVNGNPNTEWFRKAGYGIMVHYLKEVFVPEGGSAEWNETVNSFDAARFAEQASQTGAGFVMFTLGQNSGYYCSPNMAFDTVVGVKPGDLCSTRDLPMDVIKELKKYNIPVILYLPSNPPVRNKLVSEKFRYTYLKDSATSQFNQPILENMIREWSLRYGTDVKGWWFDGLYKWNNIRDSRMDMTKKYNIYTHTLAAKAGNTGSIVTYNYGFGKIQVNTPYCDYSSGEKPGIDEFPSSRWVEPGVQWFLFTYLGEKWGGKGNQFKTDDLVGMAKKIVDNEGVLCLEVVPDAKGNILPNHLEQAKAVGKALGKVQ